MVHYIYEIIGWFGKMSDRQKTIQNFNISGKKAFISGVAPTLLEVSISKGDPNYKHQFSKWFGGGFRIKALSGRPLSRAEMEDIKNVLISNQGFVRELISLGWDTLEIHDNAGYNGIKCRLIDYAQLGGIIDYKK
jgi:hypothetical protein